MTAEPKEINFEYDEFGFVKNYICPHCGGAIKQDHTDDIGTTFYRCEKCGQQSTRPKNIEKESFLQSMREDQKPINRDELDRILNSTIRHDRRNKLITFLCMLLTYTEEDQTNISFIAESSSGKSYIPLELAWYFPQEDVFEYGYVTPTAFFHEYGILMNDPCDTRDIEDEKKRKIVLIDLHQKVMIFIDQPQDMLLQRLRPLLSHDRKTLTVKITDRRERSGLRTKTVVIEGYPTVLFCTSKFSMEDQERTRLLLLSPETSQDKLKDSILLKIERESDREAFNKFMEEDPQRLWLRRRVQSIKTATIKQVIIPEDLRQKIAAKFFEKHNHLIPRHQRDIGRVIGLIKAHALLNLWDRRREDHVIYINQEDVDQGFSLYEEISTANELGLPPEVFSVFTELKQKIPENGVTRREFQRLYYQAFQRSLGKKRLEEILTILESTGLLIEEADPNDRRLKRYLLPTGGGAFSFEDSTPAQQYEINTPWGVGNDVKAVVALDPKYIGLCFFCGKRVTLTWQVQYFNGDLSDACLNCGTSLLSELQKQGEVK